MKFERDLILIIDNKIFEKMKNCVESAQPNEAFGLILGPNPKEIPLEPPGEFQYKYLGKRFECIESNKKSPVSFFVNNTEKLYKIINKANKKSNIRVLSIFHSHPSGAYPSSVDQNYMKFLDKIGDKKYSGKKIAKIFKNQIWTIMDAISKELNGFILLNGILMQIKIQFQSENREQ
ncbi:MAG: hypothetical protein GF383_12135 [Candidatus Lokiarchaeota archaeon]|nr:hypothetical protein [Candidatus Lokiarchaeota archaeon]MBD3341692.1 hypothetical protein [Candidatus Lokiarchaeota archaeon]